jgi:cell division control protein 7
MQDLHQKFFRNSKSETISRGKDTISQPALKSTPVVQAKEPVADSKQLLGSKRKRSNRSPVGSAPKNDNKSRHGIQAADVSGVTSAKDPTSTKTSLDRLKQPMPYKGRKELMNFLHDAMQSPDKNTSTAPVSQRKRVAAPLGNVDQKLFILTPMPLCSGGSAIAGSGMLNSKGNGKHRREGPCVGTKGFRAPEVLFRSFHQGCKVDVWSAGVTLLYFIIGKSPFGGDPEQNIKEIAKLRGSEELWEVAKLHNCESSYPSDLFDAKSLRSVDLREWCAANTRRPEFFKSIPDSLFDLVDKCLSVNPRCRITSEDALMHDFFAPCHDLIRQHRLARRPAPSNNLPCLPQDKSVKANESKRSSSTVPTTVNSVS